MFYTVEIDFNNPEQEPIWNEWYHNNLPLMLTVPGFETAQRFEKEAGKGFRFLAAYTLSGPEVFASDAYRDVGGGGASTVKWKQWMNRTRNLYAGIDWLPPASEDGRILLTETTPGELDLPDILFASLEAVALARDPERRYVAVTDKATVDRAGVGSRSDMGVYRPMAPPAKPRS